MPYELTINRVMALCDADNSAASEAVDRKQIAKLFRRQTRAMLDGHLGKAFNAVAAQAAKLGCRMEACVQEDAIDGDEDIEIFLMTANSPNIPSDLSPRPSNHLIGLFQSRTFLFGGNDGMRWIMRVRPSVTACALERPNGKAKLWWTFEGVPAYAELRRRPTEQEAVEFVSRTTDLGEIGLRFLYEAYEAGLSEVKDYKLSLREERIQISLADNNSIPVGELVNAMYVLGANFAQAEKGAFGKDAAEGAGEVVKFASHVHPHGKPVSAPTLEINEELTGKAAVVVRYNDAALGASTRNSSAEKIVLTGLASSAGTTGDVESSLPAIREIENDPTYLRTISAARPLSAMLANHLAMRLDAKLTPSVAKP